MGVAGSPNMSGLYGSLPPVGGAGDLPDGAALPPPPSAAVLAAASQPQAPQTAAAPGNWVKQNQFMAPAVRKRPPPPSSHQVKPSQVPKKESQDVSDGPA